MRLIDADKLIQELEKNKTLYIDEYEEGRNTGISWCIEDVVDAPTVDAVPIKHGRWLYIEGYMGDEAKCSECRRSICVNEPGNGLPNVGDLKYCPFCGAKMDERNGE